MSGPILKPAGFLRIATIQKVDIAAMIAYINFRDSVSGTDDSTLYPAQLPMSYLSAGGGFIGGYVAPGTPVIVGQAEGGGTYLIVNFLARNPAVKSTIARQNLNIPTLIPGEITIQANTDSSINLNDDGIIIGEPYNSLTFDIERSILLNSFDYNYDITQAGRNIVGAIKRDKKPQTTFGNSMRNIDPTYDDGLKIIGMDPIANPRNLNSGSSVRNPTRIESHEFVYEYEDDASIKSNDIELQYYISGNFPNNPYIIDRRAGRADAFSLSLIAPNYLMESIKGTGVDIYGNVVDLNRNIIPLGQNQLSVNQIKSNANSQNSFTNSYEQIKRAERNSIAYHFEMNARKETKGSGPPNVFDQSNYARLRSRFFLDVDKEGQIKLNVPASSETGNISLLTRYENYSTISPNSSSNDPTDLVFNPGYVDISIEPFAEFPVITLKDDTGNTVGPIDRFTGLTNIMHGTAYHNILQTCSTLQQSNFYTPIEYTTTTELAAGRVVPLNSIVSQTIVITGPNANAGGRSGSLNFDGSLDINVGANTVDRQSVWLDTQGGMVMNIGRDITNNTSIAANMDGAVYFQIGGTTPSTDTRFTSANNSFIAGTLDIRVYNANQELTVLRIDNEGLTVSTPGRIVMSANEDIMIRSGSTLYLDGDNVIINGRTVLLDPGKGTIR